MFSFNFNNFENLFIEIKDFEIVSLSKPKENFFKVDLEELKKNLHLLEFEIPFEKYKFLIEEILSKKEIIKLETKILHSNQNLKIELKRVELKYFGYFQLIDSQINQLSYLSHEIRVPIQSIIGSISLLKSDSEFNQEQKEIIHSLKNSSNHLLSLLNDILDYSKIESGKFELQKIDFYLKDLIQVLNQNFKFLAEQKNIFFLVNLSSGLEHLVFFDKQRLTQILMNLINNSIKFTDIGFVKVEIKLISKTTEFSKVLFSVKDSGIGIPNDQLEQIFESYSQAKKTTKNTNNGTGLGLSIVRKILKLMDSKIQVESEVDLGSNFYFELNIPNSIKSFLKEINEISVGKDFRRKKVLLVEDNIQNQIIAKKLLAKLNLEIEIAENGKVAIAKVKEKKFDLILMDIQLPILDGFEATIEIRKLESEILNPTPIIALTATVLEDTRTKVLTTGMNDYLPKPFSFEKLAEKISNFLP